MTRDDNYIIKVIAFKEDEKEFKGIYLLTPSPKKAVDRIIELKRKGFYVESYTSRDRYLVDEVSRILKEKEVSKDDKRDI